MSDSRTVRNWAVGVVAVAALGGTTLVAMPEGPPPATGPAREPERRPNPAPAVAREQAVDTLLRLRAEAVRTRDEAAFMASVDPKASPDFQSRQLALFRNLAEVPLANWSYEIDFTRALSVPASGSADETLAPRIDLSYALDGVDVVPTRRALDYLLVRRGDSWYLNSDDNLPAKGRKTWRGPWDYGACRVIPTGSGLILAHDANRGLAERVARMVDDSAAAVTEVWGPDWPRRVGVLLPETQDELEGMVGPEFAVDGIAAVAVADRVDPRARRVEGPRIVINPETANSLSDAALRVVLQHEITHIAARADTVDGAALWMLEGFADYVAYRGGVHPPERIAPDLARQVRTGDPPSRLPSDREFHLSGQRLDLAYQQAWSVVDFLVRRVGEQRVVELYHRVAGVSSEREVDAALRELVGWTTPELITEWGADLRHVLG